MKTTRVLCVLAIGVILFASGMLFLDTLSSREASEHFSALGTEDENPVERVEKLKRENPDTYGWITIPGTRIDYPVMHTPEDPEYYLHRDFEKNASDWGTPFLAGNCTEESENKIIYAHHMQDGTMFADLEHYRDREYADAHSKITLCTDREEEYTVWAVCYTDVKDTSFPYYAYTDFTEQSTLNAFVAAVESHARYTREINTTTHAFLTLSTCSYHTDDGRLVIVGVKE